MSKKHDAAESIRVVKSAKCPSVSRRSTLGYDVGLSPEGEVYFRVTSNSAPGAFARAWVSWTAIRDAIEAPARTKSITSAHLAGLCGRGQNTAGFLTGVLAREGLLKPSTTKKRCMEMVDDTAFLASVNSWVQAGKGTDTSARAKGQSKAGAKPAKAAKGDPSSTVEGDPADVSTAVQSLVARNDLFVKTTGQRSTATKKGSPDAPKDGTRKATKKRA